MPRTVTLVANPGQCSGRGSPGARCRPGAAGFEPSPAVGPSATSEDYRCAIDLSDAARAEVRGLHEFLVEWFTSTVADTDAAFARFSGVLHPQFAMIVPSGELLDRESVLTSIRAAHGSADPGFAIEIRGMQDRFVHGDHVLLTYEEWQYDGEQLRNGRISTAHLVPAPDAPSGLQWQHLHETFLPD